MQRPSWKWGEGIQPSGPVPSFLPCPTSRPELLSTEIRFPVGDYIWSLDGERGKMKRQKAPVGRGQGLGAVMGFIFIQVIYTLQSEGW